MVFKTVDELDRKIFVMAYKAYHNKLDERSSDGIQLNYLLTYYKNYLLTDSRKSKELLNSYFGVKGSREKAREVIGVYPQRKIQVGGAPSKESPSSKREKLLERATSDTMKIVNNKSEQENFISQAILAELVGIRQQLNEENLRRAQDNEAQQAVNRELIRGLENVQETTKKNALEVASLNPNNITWTSWATGKMALAFKNLLFVFPKVSYNLVKFAGYRLAVRPVKVAINFLAKPIEIVVGLVIIIYIGTSLYHVYLHVNEDPEINEICSKNPEKIMCSVVEREAVYALYSAIIKPLAPLIPYSKKLISYTFNFGNEGLEILARHILKYFQGLLEQFKDEIVEVAKQEIKGRIPGSAYFL